MKIGCLLLFLGLVVCTLAGVTDYQVYHTAPNSGQNWNSIGGAVNAAISAGYTCASGLRVRIVIQASETPYGSPCNTITIPCSIIIQGEFNGAFPGAKVLDTLVFSNAGSDTTTTPWGDPSRALSDEEWAHGGVQFMQTDPYCSSVIYDYYEPVPAYNNPFPFFLTFRNAMFTTILTTTYSPMLRVTWDGNAIAIDTIFQSFSATYPMVELHRSSGIEFYQCMLEGKQFVLSRGISGGSSNPNTLVICARSFMAYYSNGDIDSESYFFEIENPGLSAVQVYGNEMFQVPNGAHTQKQAVLEVAATVPASVILQLSNNDLWLVPNGGTAQWVVFSPIVPFATGSNNRLPGSYNNFFGPAQTITQM